MLPRRSSRRGARPAVAVLREQGVNSQTEMAAVFTRAGFDAYDVHMTDILARRVRLARFHGLVACGGFSYGDVLGAGEGWAKSILFNPRGARGVRGVLRAQRHLHLGVCNGCQMLAALKELIPGAEHWPRFVRNRSEQYEARLTWCACRARTRCCSPACTARCCRSRWRMARAWPNSSRVERLQLAARAAGHAAVRR